MFEYYAFLLAGHVCDNGDDELLVCLSLNRQMLAMESVRMSDTRPANSSRRRPEMKTVMTWEKSCIELRREAFWATWRTFKFVLADKEWRNREAIKPTGGSRQQSWIGKCWMSTNWVVLIPPPFQNIWIMFTPCKYEREISNFRWFILPTFDVENKKTFWSVPSHFFQLTVCNWAQFLKPF